jgi:hypothetical protein
MRQLVCSEGDSIELSSFPRSRMDLVLALSLELLDGMALVVGHVELWTWEYTQQ